MKIKKGTINFILQERSLEKTFSEIILGFDNKLKQFNPIKNSVSLEKYFSSGNGVKKAAKALIRDKIIEEGVLCKNGKKEDFKGLYIFINNSRPFYVGISRGVIQRILNHLRGENHFKATLAYNISLENFEKVEGKKYDGSRNSFEFNTYVKPAQDLLAKQRIAFLPMSNDEEMYLFEVYCSMYFKTKLNKFKTH